MSMKKPVSKDKRWRRLQLGCKFFVESALRKNQAALNNSSTEAKAPGFPSSTALRIRFSPAVQARSLNEQPFEARRCRREEW